MNNSPLYEPLCENGVPYTFSESVARDHGLSHRVTYKKIATMAGLIGPVSFYGATYVSNPAHIYRLISAWNAIPQPDPQIQWRFEAM